MNSNMFVSVAVKDSAFDAQKLLSASDTPVFVVSLRAPLSRHSTLRLRGLTVLPPVTLLRGVKRPLIAVK